MVKTGNLFLIAMLIFSSITLMGCIESNVQSPPFSVGQFVSRATDLNYSNWLNGDYNNMVLVFKNDKISVADANDLNVALPDLSGFVPYQGATADVNLGSHDLNVFNVSVIGNYLWDLNIIGAGTTSATNTIQAFDSAINQTFLVRNDGRTKIGKSNDLTPDKTLDVTGNINFDNVSEPVDTAMTLALAGAGAGNVDNGVHYYGIAFVTAEGVTGDYTLTKTVTVVDKTTNGKVSITNIPVSTDPRVTGRRIYRSKAGGGQYQAYYLATLNNNTTTTYTDNTADSSLDTTDQLFRKANTTAGILYLESDPIMKATDWFVTSLGLDALAANKSGHSIVAIGGYAMQVNTTGANGTCVGYSCMSSNITGGSNACVGNSCLLGNKYGSANTGIGTFALRSDTANNYEYNTAVGYSSMYDLNNGNIENSAFGGYAGRNFNGNGNLLLGYKSGYLPAKDGNMYYNICVGYDNCNSVSGGASENIVIGKDLELKSSGDSRQLLIGTYVEGDINGVRLNKDLNVGATEKVLNGTFDSSSTGWTTGTGWAYDAVNKEMDKNVNGTGSLGQDIFVKNGDYLRASFTVRNLTVSTFNFRIGTQVVATISADGNYSYDFVANQDGILYFVPLNTSRFSITNISVQKIGTTTTNYLKVVNDANVYGNFYVDSNIVLRSDNNLTLTSPNGSKWNCGVDNSGVFSCS